MKSFLKIAFLTFFVSTINLANAQSKVLAEEHFLKADDFKKNMKPDSALVYFEKAAVEFKKNGSIEKYVDSYNQIGIILTRQDKYDEAKNYLNTALSTGIASLGEYNLTVANTYISLGVIYNAEGNYQQALLFHNKALSIRIMKLGEFHADVATSFGNLGNVHRNNKEFDKSIKTHLKAMQIREKLFGLTSPEIIESYVCLGNAYREKKEYATSVLYFEKALQNKILQRGEGHTDLVKFYKYISEVYYLMENPMKGDEYKAKYEAIIKTK